MGSYFPDWLLERRRRAEAALVTVVATSYLLGVSTRRMERLVETLSITRLSKSQVSEMARDLDAQAPDLVQQPAGTPQPRNPPPHRRRRDLPRPRRPHPPRRPVLAEQHDEWTEMRRYIGLEILAKSRATATAASSTAEEAPLTAITA
jgi:hypothetical protein